ncbi:MAG: Rubrerythrin [Candidatus Aminicenantes bacterium]|nr:Rubrerythrin [Candidatus Aminicenantes bacterium]
MDLSAFSMEDLLLSALKAETESRDVYNKLADGLKNALLKDRLKFLSGEEEKHRIFFEMLFQQKFQGKEIALPEKTPVPLPDIKIEDEALPISEIFWRAMQAEMAAHDFYRSLAEKITDEPRVKKMLLYIATMEKGHYKLLEIEKENAEKFEAYDMEWPMMHIGA